MSIGDSPPVLPRYPKILCYGDSLTQGGSDKLGGWCNILQKFFLRRCDLYNRGLSGYTSKWCAHYHKAIFDEICGNSKATPSASSTASPDKSLKGLDGDGFLFATLWLGANDATLPNLPGKELYSVGIEDYKNNMRIMSRTLLDSYTDVLILLSTPCIHEGNRRKFALELINGDLSKLVVDRTEEHVKPYVQALREVYMELVQEYTKENGAGRKKHVYFIDTWNLFYDRREELLPDGLHFSEEGDAMVAEKILECLRQTRAVPVSNGEDGIYVDVDPVRKAYGNSGAKSSLPPVIPWHDDRQVLIF